MSIFLEFSNVSTQLNAATASTLNNVLTAFESLSFFNKSISAQNVCTNSEYEMYPLLVKYQLERTRNERNTPTIEELNVWAQEVSALELYDASIHSKITTSKTTYDALYTAQFANIATLNTNLVKQNQKSLADLNTYQKSITSTLNTSNQALTLRQSITNRLITDLTPVSVPISKARLNTFIERNANTLLHLTTAVNGITAEIQSAKLLINNSFSTLNTTYRTLSSRLKSENTAITTNVNSYTRNAINTAARLRLTGVGNNTSGVLGYRYTAGKLTNGNHTIGGVAFVFRKGLATRNNLFCNGWLGGVYYVDGFSTTLPNTGTGYWNNWSYTNGIKLQGSFSTGYYNRIPSVSSLKTIPPNVVQQAKDNKKWYNYFPGQITDFNALNQLNVQEYNRVYFIPHITGNMSDLYQHVYGAFSYNEAYDPYFVNTRTPYDNDVIMSEGLKSIYQDIGYGEYYDYLLTADGYLNQLRIDLQECQTSLTSLLTAVTGATGNTRESIIQSHFNTFKYFRESVGYYFRQSWESYVTQDFWLIHHNNFSPISWTDTITSNFMGTNIPLSPINLSLMPEFEILLGNGHNGNYQELPNSALSGIRGVSHTLSEVISGDTLGNGSNQGVKPILDTIIDVHLPTITDRLISKLSILCVSFNTTAPAPVYAQDFIFLSGGSELDILYSLYDDWGPVNFTSYLSSWTAFQVDANGVAQPFTGTYTTFIRQDDNTPPVSGYYDINFENGTYVFAPSTDGGGGGGTLLPTPVQNLSNNKWYIDPPVNTVLANGAFSNGYFANGSYIDKHGSFETQDTGECAFYVNGAANEPGVWNGCGEPIAHGEGVTTDVGDYTVYTTSGFKLYNIFRKSDTYTQNITVMNAIRLSLDKYSSLLEGTTLPEVDFTANVQLGSDIIDNPMLSIPNIGKNKGILIAFSCPTIQGNWLAAAGPANTRSSPGTRHHRTTSTGVVVINDFWLNYMINTKDGSGTPVLYGVLLHEYGHIIGVGTQWVQGVNNLNLTTDSMHASATFERLFIVGAGDSAANDALGIYPEYQSAPASAYNQFYTNVTNNNRTSAVNLIYHAPTNGWEVDIINEPPFAINVNTITDTYSHAVTAYNEALNRRVITSPYNYTFALTAIPLQNGGSSGGYGGHWAEGDSTDPGTMGAGGNNRYYYGQKEPGAPCLQDELMTPIAEGRNPFPFSKISLGAFADLGFTVNFQGADTYYPLIYTIGKNVLGWQTVARNGSTTFQVAVTSWNTGSLGESFAPSTLNGERHTLQGPLKPGTPYTFINNTEYDYLHAYLWDEEYPNVITPVTNCTRSTSPIDPSDPLWKGKDALVLTLPWPVSSYRSLYCIVIGHNTLTPMSKAALATRMENKSGAVFALHNDVTPDYS